MKIYFERESSTGSLGEIQSDLIDYLSKYFEVEPELYKGSDLSISNFICGVHSNDYFFKKNKHNILIQPIDGTSIYQHKIDVINKFDLVITPGNAGKDILIKNGVKIPIEVIPNYFKDYPLPKKNPSDKIIFYHESMLYKRKNLMGLYDAFLGAFADTELADKVKLIIKTTSKNTLNENEENIEVSKFKYTNIPEIEIIDGYYEKEELYQLWANADVYISLSHMEGFGIPLLNFTSFKKPIITLRSNISGYMDFLNDNNCYFVESRLVKDTDFSTLYTNESEWDEIRDMNQCIDVLRIVANDVINNTTKTSDLEILQKYHIDNVMDRYLETIFSLLGQSIPETVIKKSKLKFHMTSVKAKVRGLKYVTPRGNSGYAEAARSYMMVINKIMPVTWKQMSFDNTHTTDEELLKLVNRNVGWNHLLIHTTPEHWEHLINEEGYKNKGDKGHIKIIGQTVWETDKIPQSWVGFCNNSLLDEIWVPTEWNKETFKKCGVKTPIQVVPHIFTQEQLPDGYFDHIDDNDYVFYTIGQWTHRKGIAETIEAFCKGFTSSDNVCLVVKTFANNYDENEIERCKYRINKILSNFENPPKILFIPSNCTRDEILALHKRGDCYVSLCRAEGWGLGIFEAAGFGKPVITTGYSAPVEFFPNKYRLFVSYKETPVSGMGWIPWYGSNQNWAEPNIEDGANKMKEVYNNKEKYKEIGNDLKEHIRKNYGVGVVSNIIKKLIKYE